MIRDTYLIIHSRKTQNSEKCEIEFYWPGRVVLSIFTSFHNYGFTQFQPWSSVLILRQVRDIDVFRPESVMEGLKLMRGFTALSILLVDQATQADGRVVERARAWCHSLDVPFFRFSPQMSEEIAMDEKDDQKLVNMLWETKAYMIQHHTDVLRLVSLFRS